MFQVVEGRLRQILASFVSCFVAAKVQIIEADPLYHLGEECSNPNWSNIILICVILACTEEHIDNVGGV